MAEFTKEEQIQAIYDLKVGYTLGHADIAILKSMARQLLAGLEQEPVAWRWRQNESKPWHLTVHSDCAGEVQPLYAAPQLPQPAVPDISRLEDVLEWINGLPVPTKSATANYCRLKNFITDYRAAMLQGAEPVSLDYTLPEGWVAAPKPEVAQPPKSESKDGTVTVYPWLVSISFFEKDMRMWTPFSLLTHRYDDGLITKEDLHENLREWIKGEIGDNLYTITFFGRMAPYQAPQQEVK